MEEKIIYENLIVEINKTIEEYKLKGFVFTNVNLFKKHFNHIFFSCYPTK